VAGEVVSAIDQGLLALDLVSKPLETRLPVSRKSSAQTAQLPGVRKRRRWQMNLSVMSAVVCCWFSQFTLAADTRRHKPVSPVLRRHWALALFDLLVMQAQLKHPQVATGQFGADVQVHLLNDRPGDLSAGS
jgi:D-tyrosyl-tRNA(Tyr) deacylase